MTRKHYQLIAATINAERSVTTDIQAYSTLRKLVSRLCIEFANDNSRFNSETFTKACGF